jgi:hypothetical protein
MSYNEQNSITHHGEGGSYKYRQQVIRFNSAGQNSCNTHNKNSEVKAEESKSTTANLEKRNRPTEEYTT